MQAIFVEGIRRKLIDMIRKASDEGKPIDHILLTMEEKEELCKECEVPLGHPFDSFAGTPIKVEKVEGKREAYGH